MKSGNSQWQNRENPVQTWISHNLLLTLLNLGAEFSWVHMTQMSCSLKTNSLTGVFSNQWLIEYLYVSWNSISVLNFLQQNFICLWARLHLWFSYTSTCHFGFCGVGWDLLKMLQLGILYKIPHLSSVHLQIQFSSLPAKLCCKTVEI